MSEPAAKKATYQDLCGIPEQTIGEIINGDLLVTPRPSFRHAHPSASLGGKLTTSYHLGERGRADGSFCTNRK
jgi:hypothetical protein